jgi:hypothetical protein
MLISVRSPTAKDDAAGGGTFLSTMAPMPSTAYVSAPV